MEIFKEENGCKPGYFHNGQKVMSIDFANRKLKELMKVGYTHMASREKLPEHVYDEPFDSSTHRILYLTEPLGVEKVECDHIITFNDCHKVSFTEISGWVACPKCGEKNVK